MHPSFPAQSVLDRLLREQNNLLEAFAKAREAGITTDEGIAQLRRVRGQLQDHLALVDRHVYPLLRRLAAPDTAIDRALGKIEGAEVSAQVEEFFDTQLDANNPAFFSAWGALYVSVQRRFRLERTVLFPALATSALAHSLSLPGPAARLTTGPVAVHEVHGRRRKTRSSEGE